jgi:hypothetical protein
VTMQMGNRTNGVKFAACMRKHGVPNFPDPNGQGTIHIDSSMGIDPQSPKFQAAQQTCQNTLSNGGQPSPAQQAKVKQRLLAFSACMRKHGLSDFPDPTFSSSGGGFQFNGGESGSDLNPNSPKFQAARDACQANLPGRAAGGVTHTGTK